MLHFLSKFKFYKDRCVSIYIQYTFNIELFYLCTLTRSPYLSLIFEIWLAFFFSYFYFCPIDVEKYNITIKSKNQWKIPKTSFLCMFYRSLFVLLCLFFWPLCCLFFFDIRILIAPLISSKRLLISKG